MRAPAALAAFVATALLAGCETTMSGAKHIPAFDTKSKHDCGKGKPECDVEVGWLTGRVPEDIVAEAGKSTLLRWTIPGKSAFRFDEPGIVFEPNAKGVIDCTGGNPKAKEKVVECKNTGREDAKGYKYKVRLKWLGWRTQYDPYVWNQ